MENVAHQGTLPSFFATEGWRKEHNHDMRQLLTKEQWRANEIVIATNE